MEILQFLKIFLNFVKIIVYVFIGQFLQPSYMVDCLFLLLLNVFILIIFI